MCQKHVEARTCKVVALDHQVSQEPEGSPVLLAIPAARHILHHVKHIKCQSLTHLPVVCILKLDSLTLTDSGSSVDKMMSPQNSHSVSFLPL